MKNPLKYLLVLFTTSMVYQPVFGQAWDDPNGSSLPDDFYIQGEYFGAYDTDGKERLGALVRSTGSGNFDIHFCEGGLPGPKSWPMGGWNYQWKGPLTKQKYANGKITLAGSTVWTGVLEVNGDPKSAKDSDKVIRGKKQGRAFTLSRVQRTSPSEGMPPPPKAVSLFDGTKASFDNNWAVTAKGSYHAKTQTIHRGVTSKDKYQACYLHLELRGPYMPAFTGQRRSNSGVYLQGRYEVQITDSFGIKGLAGDQKGGLYKDIPPLVNATYPPLRWETMDILFTPAKFSGGKKVENCSFTVWLNGIRVHDNSSMNRPGQGGAPEGPTAKGVFLQNHGGDNVYFRNIWILENPADYPDTNWITGKYANGISMWKGCPDPGYVETNPGALVVDKKYCNTKSTGFSLQKFNEQQQRSGYGLIMQTGVGVLPLYNGKIYNIVGSQNRQLQHVGQGRRIWVTTPVFPNKD